MSGWSPPPASPSSAARSGASTSTPPRSSACAAARCRSTSPASRSCSRATRERLHFSTDAAPMRSSTRACCSSPSARRRPTPATPTSRPSTPSSTRSPPPTHHALVMKSTVPVPAPASSIQRVFGEQGKDGLRYVSCPEFLKEGSAVKDFLHPDRVVVGDVGDWAGDAVVELYAPLAARRSCAPTSPAPRWSSSPPTRSWRRRSRSSTRSPTSARRPAPTSSRSRAGWDSTIASARSSCRRGSASAGRASPGGDGPRCVSTVARRC